MRVSGSAPRTWWRRGQEVLVEGAGPLVVAQPGKVAGNVGGRVEGGGVIGAQDPLAAAEGVLVEGAGLPVVARFGVSGGPGRGPW